MRKDWIPNFITLSSLGLGVAAIALASDPDMWATGCLLIGVCAFLDMIDGKVARALRASSAMGLELDSLADLVAFGIGPALLAYHGYLKSLGAAGLAVAALYAVGCAFRLGRYNVLATQPHRPSGFVGCPAPVGAVTLTALLLTLSHYAGPISPLPVVIGTLAVAFVMVSVIPYRKDMPWDNPLFMALSVMLLVVFREYFVLAGGVAYMVLGPVLAVAARVQAIQQDRAA